MLIVPSPTNRAGSINVNQPLYQGFQMKSYPLVDWVIFLFIALLAAIISIWLAYWVMPGSGTSGLVLALIIWMALVLVGLMVWGLLGYRGRRR